MFVTVPDYAPMSEQALTGGNTSVVHRVGDTVRRSAGHWTPAVHALLTRLRAAGFTDVPIPLGWDEQGREMLAYVPGEVGTLDAQTPLPPWFRSVEACGAVGRWLRGFHDAQRGWQPDPGLPWRMVPGRPLAAGELVCHRDVSPYNTVRRPDGGITVLDWDFARPGRPLEDLAWAAWMWVPLIVPTGPAAAEYGYPLTPQTQRARLAALLEGYGDPRIAGSALRDAVVAGQLQHADDLERLAAAGDPAFVALCERGYASLARADAAWVRDCGLFE